MDPPPIILLSVLLTGLVTGAASAQSGPPSTTPARANQLHDTNSTFCAEPSNPQALSAAVNLCLDRLVKADVQDLPGARFDVNILPPTDPELLAAPDTNRFPPRAQPLGATSWGQPAKAQLSGMTSTLTSTSITPDATRSPAMQLPALPILASTEVDNSASLQLASASTLDRKLSRDRSRKQEEDRRRQSRELQRNLDQQCRQLHLSNLECRLKLKSRKLAAISQRTERIEKSQQHANH